MTLWVSKFRVWRDSLRAASRVRFTWRVGRPFLLPDIGAIVSLAAGGNTLGIRDSLCFVAESLPLASLPRPPEFVTRPHIGIEED